MNPQALQLKLQAGYPGRSCRKDDTAGIQEPKKRHDTDRQGAFGRPKISNRGTTQGHKTSLLEFLPYFRLEMLFGYEFLGMENNPEGALIHDGVLLRKAVEYAPVRAIISAEPDSLLRLNGIKCASERQRLGGVHGNLDLRLDDLPPDGLSKSRMVR
jgi:hypothetical protein